jgi:hypothetical protein
MGTETDRGCVVFAATGIRVAPLCSEAATARPRRHSKGADRRGETFTLGR